MQQESAPDAAMALPSSALKRSILLSARHTRLRIDPDASVANLHSAAFRKLLFGREIVEPFKIQAGIVISRRQRDMNAKVSPSSVSFYTAGQEVPLSTHVISLCVGESAGYTRSISYRNNSEGPVRLRVLTLHDPTSLNFRQERDPPGEIGVNAFNRGDHVVMDDVGDTTGVRVIGFEPRPSAIYLTRARQKALDLLNAGELPGSTAGMSGAILVLSQHDTELPPGGSFNLRLISLYHPSSLEAVLAEHRIVRTGAPFPSSEAAGGPGFRCSSPSVNFAFAWAKASIGSLEYEDTELDRLSAGFGLGALRPDYFVQDFAASKASQCRDGLLTNADSRQPGPMETSFFITNACSFVGLRSDKRLGRKWFPALRKAGYALETASAEGMIVTRPGSPDGWRRLLGSGYPTGYLAEVNLAAARALGELASLARLIGKQTDSARFRAASERIQKTVGEKLRDVETGNLALNLDQRGRLHTEPTVDQAVALSHAVLDEKLASFVVHRLLEKDFETGYGPRSVSAANALYYSPDYGEGQLGGCWTRAALAHAILAYKAGVPSVGSAQLEKVATMVQRDCEQMGGIPGEFPYWFDPERMRIRTEGSDPVAASRFVEALLVGEGGLVIGSDGPRMTPPAGSRLSWFTLHDFPESGVSVFVGRSHAGELVISSTSRIEVAGSLRFLNSELLETSPSSLDGEVFWDQACLVLCVGNSSDAPVSSTVRVPLREKPLASSLYADLEEFDQGSWTWGKRDRIRVRDTLELSLALGPGAWRVLKASRIPTDEKGYSDRTHTGPRSG